MAPVKCSAPSSRWPLPIAYLPLGQQGQRSSVAPLFFIKHLHGLRLHSYWEGNRKALFSHRIINQHIKVRKTIFNGTATLHSLLPPPFLWHQSLRRPDATNQRRFKQPTQIYTGCFRHGIKVWSSRPFLHEAGLGSWRDKATVNRGKRTASVSALSAFTPLFLSTRAAWQPGLGDRVCDNQATSHHHLV